MPTDGKLWRLKYRFEGKEKLLSMGNYRPSPGRTRDRRNGAKQRLAGGVEPSAERKAQKQAALRQYVGSFEAVANAWLAHSAGRWKPGTLDAIRASLEVHVFPALGASDVRDLPPAAIREAVKAIEISGTAETAGRVFQRIRAIYRYAIAHDLAGADPTYPLKPSEIFKPRKVTHRASLAEKDVAAFLAKLDTYDGDPSTRVALELLMLTAMRPCGPASWAALAGMRSTPAVPHGASPRSE